VHTPPSNRLKILNSRSNPSLDSLSDLKQQGTTWSAFNDVGHIEDGAKSQSLENDPQVLIRPHWLTMTLGSFSRPTIPEAFFAFTRPTSERHD
jgi:hypothetical protein